MISFPLQMHAFPNAKFQTEGYFIIRKAFSQQYIDQLNHHIQQTLQVCAQELSCSIEQYLGAVSRWVAPSPVTADVPQLFIEKLSQMIEKILLEPVSLQKMNLISKNKYSFEEIPFHQDISYSREAPYQLSAWLALHDTPEEKGPLEVIPGSHLRAIEKAVDFWSPDYEPENHMEKHAIKLTIKAGDVILFDSRLWHGSSKNYSNEDRFALVTRWSSINWNSPDTIPSIEPMRFGMWTCGKTTEDLLRMGLHVIANDSKDHYLDILESWIQFLQAGGLPFTCDQEKATAALLKVKTLHLAYTKHNGGDATGTVYKNLWENFLAQLEKYLEQTKSNPF